MASPSKIPYNRMESSAFPFASPKWKEFAGSRGCIPLATQKTVSIDRLAPGETLPKPPKLTREQVKAQKAEGQRQKVLAQLAAKQQAKKDKPEEKATQPTAEECEKPPVFDLQDIPDAMEKVGWSVSAKLARSWFSRPKHIYDDDMSSVQPIDDTTVTLDWALGFKEVKKKHKELLFEAIYNENSIKDLKKKIGKHIKKIFVDQKSINLSFNTTASFTDLLQFHIERQFQYITIDAKDTLNNFTLTDLTGSLANFNIYAAIGNAVVYGDKYFKYDNQKRTKTFCLDPKVEVTHIFVYIKDNYSFNDEKDSKKSQYLGHWNKNGLIVTIGGKFSDNLDGKRLHTDLGNSPEDRSQLHTIYLTANGLDMLVDIRKGLFRKHRKKDVYFPIYNKNYNEWREKHNRGGDFMVYSKPKYIKLKNPIKFSLETVCWSPEPM